jgi:hypothetical protein
MRRDRQYSVLRADHVAGIGQVAKGNMHAAGTFRLKHVDTIFGRVFGT